MLGVKKLVDKWKPLLVGAGGGSGEPGAYDDPYYFCYDQVPSPICMEHLQTRIPRASEAPLP